MPSYVSRRQITLGIGAFGGLALALPHVARGAARVIRFGHNNTDQSHYGVGAAGFAAAVAADPVLSGVLRVEVHGNSELGDELSLLKSCAAGTLDCAIISNAVMGNVLPEAGVLNAPFLFRDVAHARALLDGKIGEEFTALAATKNVKVLAWSENGLRHITSNIPIRTPADLHGLKIRVPQSEVMVGGFKALGADPHSLNFSLLPEALRTGEFQAQENPIVVIEANKFYEFQKCLSLTGHIYDPAAYVCSADLAEDLSAAQLAALVVCARKGSELTRQVSASAQSGGIARLQSAGMIVISDVDVDAFRAATRSFREGLTTHYGAELIGRLLAAVS